MVGFVTCGPNEALVVSGCCYSKPLLVRGGMAFVWPFIQQVQRLSLNTMSLSIESPKVYTNEGVAISVTGIAQVKIQGQNEEMLLNACQQFLGKKEKQIRKIALETLEGHQRAIIGAMSVEEISKDRKTFSKNVFEVASSDLLNMGIIVVSYTIKDLRDEYGFLKALGEARTAEVKRDARVGESEAHRDSLIQEALAEEKRVAARFLNDSQILSAKHDYEIKKASYDMEVQAKKAEANLASELQAAKTRQKIKEEEMQIRVIERAQNIQVEEQEIIRKCKELEAMVKKPADAERYRMEQMATAERNRVITEAEAEAEAIKMKGEATAFATRAKAEAEAEQMARKAEAYKEYREAALVDMILETTPKLVAEVTGPLCQTNKIQMISSGEGGVGAAKLTNEVLEIVSKVPDVVKKFTNFDIAKGMKTFP